MSDLFHPEIPADYMSRVFRTMVECPQHTFQVLTKRSDRLAELAPALPWPENIWIGASVENRRVIRRVAELVSVPAAVRFLSCEPLIGPLDSLPLKGIHWVIVGGESGPRARPMQAEWAAMSRRGRSLLLQAMGWSPKGPHRAQAEWSGVRRDARIFDQCGAQGRVVERRSAPK